VGLADFLCLSPEPFFFRVKNSFPEVCPPAVCRFHPTKSFFELLLFSPAGESGPSSPLSWLHIQITVKTPPLLVPFFLTG